MSLSEIQAAKDVASVLPPEELAEVPAGNVGAAAAMNAPVAGSGEPPLPAPVPQTADVAAPAIVPAVQLQPVPPVTPPDVAVAGVTTPAPADASGVPVQAAAGPAETGTTAGIGASAGGLPAPGDSVLKPGIKINVTVYGSGVKECSEQDKLVSADGKVFLPLVGEVQAADKTLATFRDELTAAYGRYLRQPLVEISFSASNSSDLAPWGYVTVLGRVVKPGRINMLPGGDMTVSLAIQKAGGLGQSAKDSAIMVVRKTGQGDGVERFQVDLNAASRKGADADVRLQVGDVVFVPVSIF